MTNYVGDDNDNTFTIGTGRNNVDGRGGEDLLILNLANIVGNIDTFNSGGVITNNLASDDPNLTVIGIGNIERVNLTAGAGNDEIYLFAGSDTVFGGAGNDNINTRSGLAVVDGGTGVDIWLADLSTATDNGVLDLNSSQKQTFLGGSVKAIESLQITIGSGNDKVLTLTGSSGRGTNDTVIASGGDDTLGAGGGQDLLNGGDGNDLAIIDFSLAPGDIDTFNSGGVVTNNLTGLDNYTVGLGGIERVHFTAGAGNDELYLFGGDDTVFGGDGNDTINTRGGLAKVDGGAGVDIWLADLSTATQNGKLDLNSGQKQAFLGGSVKGVESLYLTTGSGNDRVLTLTGQAGRGTNDTITAGGGDDTLGAGGGQDLLAGGDGDDLAIIDFSKAGGAIDTFNSGGSITNNLSGLDNYSVGLSSIERVDFTGSAGADEFYLFAGDDTVSAGGGDDVINSRQGSAVIDGGGGRDVWIADLAATIEDSVLNLAATGKQAFLGGSVKGVEALQLTLGSGDHTIYTLTGQAGRGHNDALGGGSGDDVFKIGGGRDSMSGGDGEDLLIIDYSKAVGAFTTSHSGAILSNELGGMDEATVFIGGFEHIDITTAGGNDYLYVSGGSDTINGGGGADTMYGRTGDDTYYVDDKGDQVMESAGGGHDLVYSSVTFVMTGRDIEDAVLTGNASRDLVGNTLANTLTGNKGANVILGGGAADTMVGGAGADTFDYDLVTDSTVAAADRILDLTNADTIDLSGIDANSLVAGDQAFVLVGSFSGQAGQMVLRYGAGSDLTFLEVDVNGDKTADMRVIIEGDHADFDNFVL